MSLIKREKPIVKSCCCGCTLYTGTITFTVLDLVNALLSALGTIVFALALQTVKDDALKDQQDLVNGLYGLLVFFSIYYVVVVILSSLAIHGARTTHPKLLIPWLVSLPIRELLRIIVAIVMWAKASDYAEALVAAYQQFEINGDGSVTMSGYDASQFKLLLVSQAIGFFVEALILVYVFLVVYSLYTEMGRMRRARK